MIEVLLFKKTPKLTIDKKKLELELAPLFQKYKILYLGLSGSILHGTETPDSDLDIRGIYLPSKESLLLKKNKNYIKKTFTIDGRDVDFVLQSVHEFFNKLKSMECNAVELLFSMRTDCVLWETNQSIYIFKNRMKFLRKDISSFKGMASANLKGKGFSRKRHIRRANKEIAHGIRTIQEAKELLENLNIQFPLKNVKYVAAIKKGVYDFDTISVEIDNELSKLEYIKAPLTQQIIHNVENTLLGFYN